MRWTHTRPNEGDTRQREDFLILPKRIGDETRWLERAEWEEEFSERIEADGAYLRWQATKWID